MSTPSFDPGAIVADIRRGDDEIYRVALKQYEGRPYLDLRIWARATSGGNQFVPTKKGVSLRRAAIPELLDAIKRGADMLAATTTTKGQS